MMRINGLNGANAQAGTMKMPQAIDSVGKNIQNQIANAQKQLQELSSNEELSTEDKMKKRQELQKQIADLNNQLRQHQIEQHREKQQAKDSQMDNSKKTTAKAGNQGAGLSQASMKAVISADTAMSQAQVQGSVATRMEGRAGVLETEIKLDGSRGGDVEAKKEELAEVEQKAAAATASQMNTLADADKELKMSVKAEQQTKEAGEKETKTNRKDEVSEEKQDGKVTGTETEAEVTEAEMQDTVVETDTTNAAAVSVPEKVAYTPIDIRL